MTLIGINVLDKDMSRSDYYQLTWTHFQRSTPYTIVTINIDMALQNQAAYLDKVGATLRVAPAPIAKPGPEQVLVRTRAIGINPVDWMVNLSPTKHP